jgi:hypothetical protein
VPLRSGVIGGERERRSVWAPGFRILLYLYDYGNLTFATGTFSRCAGGWRQTPPQPTLSRPQAARRPARCYIRGTGAKRGAL